MKINRLFLTNFRNIKKCELDVSAKQVILRGENGQGKTNLLEALYILCYGSSFRTKNLKECINYNSDYFYLSSDFEDSDSIQRMTEFSFDSVEKSIKLDGNQIHDRKELIYTIPCIVFSHEDMEFVRGEPEFRRRFFDQTMSMYDSLFFDDLRRYKTILRQRNAAIKSGRTGILDIYDLKLAECGKTIVDSRKSVCSEFNKIFPSIYEQVSQDDRQINISYRPSWKDLPDVQSICDFLKQQRESDIKMQTTTSGPHRDRFILTDRNGIFANYASTGQMRLASLVFRSAQAEFYRQKTNKNPIFLIDDVLLELDNEKRARYIKSLGNYNQAFFTFLPEEKYFGNMSECDLQNMIVYNVKDGGFEVEVYR